MPVDGLDEAVDVLQELPGEAALADAALAGDGNEPDAPIAGGRVVQVLEQRQLIVAANERRLEPLGAPSTAALRDDAQRPPGGDRRGLALEQLVGRLLEGDRTRCGMHRRLADQHRALRSHRLQAAGGVDHVAGDHPLADGADRDRRLSGQHAGSSLHRRPQPADAADELERRPHGPLGIVLMAGRRSPDGHHGVADELLDDAAVALDDPAREVEVRRQEFANLLGIPVLGERGELDEVGEEDGDHAPLGDRGRGHRRGFRGSRS